MDQLPLKEPPLKQLMGLLETALEGIAVVVPPLKIEQMAILIYTTMDKGRRRFHTTEHVLEVSRHLNPHQTLAGLFHDIVYVQVDDGLPGSIAHQLTHFVKRDGHQIVIHTDLSEDQPEYLYFCLCLDIFGFQQNQILSPAAGMNEFLSALGAMCQLGEYVPVKDLVVIAAGIESTIPFRPKDQEGKSSFDHLEDRLGRINQIYNLGFSAEEICQILRDAVELVNRDVENFMLRDAGSFLDRTWALLPETNAGLLESNSYSITYYRAVLSKMESFFITLDPAYVFRQYKQTPSDQELAIMTARAAQNIDIAREYIGAKLLSIALLEALAMVTGGDAPISMFLGQFTDDGSEAEQIEHYLPGVRLNPTLPYNPVVLQLLELGRTSPTSFDLKNSPITAFIYKLLGKTEIQQKLLLARDLFAGQISPRQFLEQMDPRVVSPIAYACAKLVPTRRDVLIQWARPCTN